ncbi:MAG: hypothetical protein ACREFT_01030 [Acetobacteraceae bacterium]
MPSPLDLDFGSGAAQGAPPVASVPTNSPLGLNFTAPASTAPTPGQQAAAIWAQTPGWQKPLLFVGQGINEVGTGLDRLLGMTGPAPTAHRDRFAAPPAKQASPAVWNALDQQHPGYNYGIKWPTEFAASAPLGEGAGALVGKALPELPAGANLLTRMLYRAPAAVARGAAYGVQQPNGTPAVNAGVGAVAGPLFEGGASLGGKALGLTAQGAQGLARKFFPRELTQPELDSVLSKRFAERGLPSAVTPKATAPGVELTTAVHSGNPNLMALQAAERISGNGTPFYEMAGANNQAIVNGLQQRFAPQADSSIVSTAAHDLLQGAQKRGKAAVRAAYEPFDQVKGGVYLERAPIQRALSEAYSGLLPAHQEELPAKLRDVMETDQPLHLTNDIEDLSARLNDAYRNAKPGTTAARAAVIMRDALQKGVDEAPLANQPHPGALIYDPARAPLPSRNMAASDPTQDSVLGWLAKHPRGLSSAEGVAQGLDPADMRSGLARVGIRRAFRNGGMTFDQAAEALHQAGYPVADEHGNYSPNILLDAIDNELRGHPTYSMANTRQGTELAHEAATATPPTREPPDLMDLARRAMEVNPQSTQAILDGWTDDSPETLARMQKGLQDVAQPPQVPNATGLWQTAKAANTAFRERFPQGTAKDTEARQWLSRWLSGRKDSSRFLTEAMVSPARAQTVLDTLKDSPAEQEQMRGLLRNGYVNRLLSATREGIPGTRTLNADALTRARSNNSALERVLLNPSERGTLDQYVQAAHDNAKILQRLHSGSSETAALRNYGKENESSVTEELLKHGASHLHPVAGLLAHVLPALAKSPDNGAALQRRLVSALTNPQVYNQVAGAPTHIASPLEKLLSGLARPTQVAVTRPAVFGVSRALGPALSGVR